MLWIKKVVNVLQKTLPPVLDVSVLKVYLNVGIVVKGVNNLRKGGVKGVEVYGKVNVLLLNNFVRIVILDIEIHLRIYLDILKDINLVKVKNGTDSFTFLSLFLIGQV